MEKKPMQGKISMPPIIRAEERRETGGRIGSKHVKSAISLFIRMSPLPYPIPAFGEILRAMFISLPLS